jgi:sporulation integral membrane protein YtvI
MEYAFGLVMPFLIAFCVALVLQKPIDFVMRRTKWSRSLVSAISVLVLLVVFGFVLSMLVIKVINELKGFFSFISLEVAKLPETFEGLKAWLLGVVHILPDSVEPDVREYITLMSVDNLVKDLGENFDVSWLMSPLGGVWSTAKQIPNVLISLFITIISAFFITLDFHIIRDFFYRQFSYERAEKLRKTKRVIFSSVGKMLKAYCIIMVITGTEVFLGLSLLRLLGFYEGNYAISIAIITALVDILPVLGSGTVLIPWGLFSLFVLKQTGLGIGLIVLYTVILVIRNVLEPKLVANQVGLPAIVTIMGMYLGTKIFGPIGLFLVPFLIIMLKLLNDEGILHLFKTKEDDDESAQEGVIFSTKKSEASPSKKE